MSLISTGTSVDLACLCLSAAFFAPLIFEKMDILNQRTGWAEKGDKARGNGAKRTTRVGTDRRTKLGGVGEEAPGLSNIIGSEFLMIYFPSRGQRSTKNR